MSVASAREIGERYQRVCAEVGGGVTVVVATGENRAQDLECKHALYGDAFRWHFIGHLQSNKVKVVNDICELVHSLSSDSAARRLTIPALPKRLDRTSADSTSSQPSTVFPSSAWARRRTIA
ncbi:MAG: alanine racemase domain protein [Thermoleophilia bacterium]|nr:alanine racemase domain protein [Thermoleophilia bacterium]